MSSISRALLWLSLTLLAVGNPAAAAEWSAVETAARGQTVYFNAWGGDPATNDFIAWAGDEVRRRFGVTVTHVKLRDTAEAVQRVSADKLAGRTAGGGIDLVWINGENFRALKDGGMLYGPFAASLPNAALVDASARSILGNDFTVPVDGYESPWWQAQLVFVYDSARLPEPPTSIADLARWAAAHPGRFAHPNPQNFLGAAFLEQAALELAADPEALRAPMTEPLFAAQTASLWPLLDALKPGLWSHGALFPENGPAALELLGDGSIDMTLSFSPSEASAGIASGRLPATVRTLVTRGGTIGNASFVAIPYDATAREGAMVLANFLLSPEAQARSADPAVLGNPTVLDMARLTPGDRERFERLKRGPATLAPDQLGRPLREPHPSWSKCLVAEWLKRYGS